MKINVFHGHRNHKELTQTINEWIKTAISRGDSILDIDYGYAADGSFGWYSAMLHYDKGTGGTIDMQVHIFHGHREYEELQNKVNA